MQCVPHFPDSVSRILSIHKLFSECSHQEQLHLLEELTDHLKTDFFQLLPLELVEQVLSYLPPTCILGSCVQVTVPINLGYPVPFPTRLFLPEEKKKGMGNSFNFFLHIGMHCMSLTGVEC